jgi:hypothetical protein
MKRISTLADIRAKELEDLDRMMKWSFRMAYFCAALAFLLIWISPETV